MLAGMPRGHAAPADATPAARDLDPVAIILGAPRSYEVAASFKW